MLKRAALACCALMSFAGCAGTVAVIPDYSREDVEEYRREVHIKIVDSYLDQQARVDRIAWPILQNNTELCRKFTRSSYGFKLGDAKVLRDRIDGLTLNQLRAIGYDSTPFVMQVAENGPAGRAGLKRGMRIVEVDGTDLKQDLDILSKTILAREQAYATFGKLPPMKLTVTDGERVEIISIEAERICAPEITVVKTNQVNASAGTERISIFSGLLEQMPDDNNVALVVGHELAHIAGRHVRKTVANSTRSGYVLWGLPIQAGAGLVDFVVAGPLEALTGVETGPGNALVTRLQNGVLRTQDFEREADYVGLYMASRAGYDISDAEETFLLLGRISPTSTYGERTHPTTPERIAAITVTRKEIEEKEAAEERIVPFGWPIFDDPKPESDTSEEEAGE